MHVVFGETRQGHRLFFVPFVVFLHVVDVVPAAAQTASPTSGVELGSLNRGADPCTDFYEFACGGWVTSHPLQPDQRSFGRVQELQDRNFAVLRRILETPGGTGDRARASDYYAACMDEAAIEAKGVAALAPELARIAAVTREHLPAFLPHLQDVATVLPRPNQWMSTPLFGFGSSADFANPTQQIAVISTGGFALPDRDMYLKTDERTLALRDKYRTQVRQVLMLLGAPPDEAADGARAVVAIETALADASLDPVSRRDPQRQYNPTPAADLRLLTPDFDWTTFFAATSAPRFTTINVRQPAYLKAVNTIVAGTPMSGLRAYFRWHLAHASALMLPAAVRQADFEFFGRALRGQQTPLPRWRDCVSETDERLGEALGKAFVEETFPPRAKSDTLDMVHGIKAAMTADIAASDWMTEPTKKAALLKLESVIDRIGYPDAWRDYSTMRIATDDAVGNYQRAVTFAQQREYELIGKPVDRGAWIMTPPTVNAYYNQLQNNINFPAGMLQPPFYKPGRDAAVNYGGAGSMIGHELTHGFDDKGREFDGQGNHRDWWTAADGKAYEQRASCIADQYGQYTVAGDTRINGRLTLGENTADNGGLRLALMAYLAGPGATPQPWLDGFAPEQRLFLGFAQLWCENTRPEAERLKAATNPHSSNKYRVNGPISNMLEFQHAFSCKADAPMVRQKACGVW